MAIWSGIVRGITRMIGWGLRKIGLGVQEMSKRLMSYGIDPYQASVQRDLRLSVSESDYWGTYDRLSNTDKVPQSMLLETTMGRPRNFRTVYQVTLYNPTTEETITKYSSIYHDRNISNSRLKNILRKMYDERQEYYEYKDFILKDARRMLVYHRQGFAY